MEGTGRQVLGWGWLPGFPVASDQGFCLPDPLCHRTREPGAGKEPEACFHLASRRGRLFTCKLRLSVSMEQARECPCQGAWLLARNQPRVLHKDRRQNLVMSQHTLLSKSYSYGTWSVAIFSLICDTHMAFRMRFHNSGFNCSL